ncbi:hypothetical protein ACFPPD_02590 [Cohnella suwonensis]|uniref:Uncharacterized protein n=1 Tax=Cohnella suwonensis TaxID=696072 RepID=A0ABW0LSM0_9BACL
MANPNLGKGNEMRGVSKSKGNGLDLGLNKMTKYPPSMNRINKNLP